MIGLFRRRAVLALVVLISACSSNSGPTAPSNPSNPVVDTVVRAEIRLAGLPADATSVAILFGYPAQNGFRSVPGTSATTPYGCDALPINSSGIYTCSATLRSDVVPGGRYGVKALVMAPSLFIEKCEPMFANSQEIPCTGKDPLGDYATFTVTADGRVLPG